MDLIDGDFIISEHSLEETYSLIESALTAAANEHATWEINVDRRAARVSAEAAYQKPINYKRTLLMEINLFDMTENRTRLELSYSLIPFIDIKPAEQFLRDTVQNIAGAVSSDAVVYSRSAKLPEELRAVAKRAEGSDSLLQGFELAIIANIIFFLAGLLPGLGWLSAMFVKAELFIGVPMVVIALVFGSKPKNSLPTVPQKRSLLGTVFFWSLSIVGGIAFTLVALPIIAFGLCIGLSFILSAGR